MMRKATINAINSENEYYRRQLQCHTDVFALTRFLRPAVPTSCEERHTYRRHKSLSIETYTFTSPCAA